MAATNDPRRRQEEIFLKISPSTNILLITWDLTAYGCGEGATRNSLFVLVHSFLSLICTILALFILILISFEHHISFSRPITFYSELKLRFLSTLIWSLVLLTLTVLSWIFIQWWMLSEYEQQHCLFSFLWWDFSIVCLMTNKTFLSIYSYPYLFCISDSNLNDDSKFFDNLIYQKKSRFSRLYPLYHFSWSWTQ